MATINQIRNLLPIDYNKYNSQIHFDYLLAMLNQNNKVISPNASVRTFKGLAESNPDCTHIKLQTNSLSFQYNGFHVLIDTNHNNFRMWTNNLWKFFAHSLEEEFQVFMEYTDDPIVISSYFNYLLD